MHACVGADGVGAALYSRSTARARVAGRWPPRAQAALDAFLRAEDTGSSLGYDQQPRSFSFLPALHQAGVVLEPSGGEEVCFSALI